MEVELPSIPLSLRPRYTPIFKAHKTQLDRTKKSLREARQGLNRSDLLSSGDPGLSDDPYEDTPGGGGGGDYGQRTRLLKGTERLQDGEYYDSMYMGGEIELTRFGIGDEQGRGDWRRVIGWRLRRRM